MKGFTQLAHVALKVNDLDRSLDFYAGKLGFPEMIRLHNATARRLARLPAHHRRPVPRALSRRRRRSRARPRGHRRQPLLPRRRRPRRGGGRDRGGGHPAPAAKKMGADFNRQAWIEDPDGNRIELMQIMPDCLQLKAIEAMKKDRAVTA